MKAINFPWEHASNKEKRFTLKNNVTVYTVTNSPIVHSEQWVEMLEDMMGRPLSSIDAVVLGQFNSCRLDKGTNYAKEMMEQSGISCADNEGPTVKEMAAVYGGPLAFAGMYHTARLELDNLASDMVQDLRRGKQGRKNVKYIDARKYIDLSGMECGSHGHGEHDCHHEIQKARIRYHRCVGPEGGHPDLIAWDAMEFMRKQLVTKKIQNDAEAVSSSRSTTTR